MPRKAIPLPEWIPQACAFMVKHDLSLRQAAAELGEQISIEEAEALKDRKLFKECLEEARIAYYTELGSSPRLSKELIVGEIFKLAMRLAEDREDYKAADALLKLAKIQGWVGYEPDSMSKVLTSLNQAEIDQLKRQIGEKRQSQQRDRAKLHAEALADPLQLQ
jgi:hypothetical protein